jgi:hypothetical protein
MNGHRISALICAAVCTEATMITLLNHLPSDGAFGTGLPGWLKATLLISVGIILYFVYDSATIPDGVSRKFTASNNKDKAIK